MRGRARGGFSQPDLPLLGRSELCQARRGGALEELRAQRCGSLAHLLVRLHPLLARSGRGRLPILRGEHTGALTLAQGSPPNGCCSGGGWLRVIARMCEKGLAHALRPARPSRLGRLPSRLERVERLVESRVLLDRHISWRDRKQPPREVSSAARWFGLCPVLARLARLFVSRGGRRVHQALHGPVRQLEQRRAVSVDDALEQGAARSAVGQ
mmetsp:Transcript_26333/g.77237  ORF Transcript_26333/g.77237 Transcript_26333/m.77237 type:complete len:212 (+) Transcript_26333:134-769(+)